MIEVLALTRHFGNTLAVDDVSFNIGGHEVVGLLGHNGAGKTTIMRMLSGYLEPSAGNIVIDGVDLSQDPASVQKRLGYLPENLPVYPEMLVADYLEYVATLKGIAPGARLNAVREAMATTDLLARALDPINTLSRGYKQRVGVAQAIMGQPKLLILDEPTNGLDPGQTEHMRELITQLARHATVILSTHILQEVDAICDRVLMLRNGQLALDRSMGELKGSKTLVLRTDADAQALPGSLQQLPLVASVERIPNNDSVLQLGITLQAEADLDAAANDIAQHVLGSGARLYQLEMPTHNLEKVFREVVSGAD